MLAVFHDLNLAAQYSDRLILLDGGESEHLARPRMFVYGGNDLQGLRRNRIRPARSFIAENACCLGGGNKSRSAAHEPSRASAL